MKETIIEDYLVDYIPERIGSILAEEPIPDMAGTLFTLQVTIAGGQNLTFGIAIQDGRHITVIPGEIENPMIALTIPDDVMRPVVKLISSFTGRRQYDQVKTTKGSMDTEIEMPGGWSLPVRTVFNGAAEPNFKLSGSSRELGRMASGSVDPTQAFMQGLIKLNGDISFALKLSQLAVKK